MSINFYTTIYDSKSAKLPNNLWRLAERYLHINQKSYEVTQFSGSKVELQEIIKNPAAKKKCGKITAEILLKALKVASYVFLPLSISSLIVVAVYRKKYQFTVISPPPLPARDNYSEWDPAHWKNWSNKSKQPPPLPPRRDLETDAPTPVTPPALSPRQNLAALVPPRVDMGTAAPTTAVPPKSVQVPNTSHALNPGPLKHPVNMNLAKMASLGQDALNAKLKSTKGKA